MFYDVTLLTGADVKTFQGESGKKPASGEKELAHQGCVCVCVCVCARVCECAYVCVGGCREKKRETLQSIYATWMRKVGSFDVPNCDFFFFLS